MEVRMRTVLGRPAGTVHPGEVVDLPEGQARDLIERGYAVQPGAPDDSGPQRRRGRRERAVAGARETETLV